MFGDEKQNSIEFINKTSFWDNMTEHSNKNCLNYGQQMSAPGSMRNECYKHNSTGIQPIQVNMIHFIILHRVNDKN